MVGARRDGVGRAGEGAREEGGAHECGDGGACGCVVWVAGYALRVEGEDLDSVVSWCLTQVGQLERAYCVDAVLYDEG